MVEEEKTPEEIEEQEGSESDEEFESESEEVSDEVTETTYSAENTEVKAARQYIKRTLENVDVAAGSAVEMDELDSTYKDGTETGDTVEDKPGERIKEKKARASKYREEKVGTQKRKGRLFARVKGISLLLGLTSTAISALSLLINSLVAARTLNGGEDDSQLTEEEKKKLQDQVRRWWALADEDVWEAVAKYCDRWNPSWQAQILMMDSIKDLSQKLAPPWTWRGDDEADLVDDIANTYADFTPDVKQHQSSAIYRYIVTLTYDGFQRGSAVPLPRQVAADVAELAITDIVLKEDTASGG